MADILEDLRKVERLRGDTYSSAEVLGMVGRAAAEIERLHATIRAMRGRLVTLRNAAQHEHMFGLASLIQVHINDLDRPDQQSVPSAEEGK